MNHTNYSGTNLAAALYGSGPSGVFQVRSSQGKKVAEFDNPEETKHFLRGHNHNSLEVWHLESHTGALKEIYPAENFITKFHLNHNQLTDQ